MIGSVPEYLLCSNLLVPWQQEIIYSSPVCDISSHRESEESYEYD